MWRGGEKTGRGGVGVGGAGVREDGVRTGRGDDSFAYALFLDLQSCDVFFSRWRFRSSLFFFRTPR